MGLFHFLKVKKCGFDKFLDKSLSVNERLDYAIKELEKRTLAYKEQVISLRINEKTLEESAKNLKTKATKAKKEAKDLKTSGNEALAKARLAVSLSFEKGADEMEKTLSSVKAKADKYETNLIMLNAKKEILAANAEVCKTKASATSVLISETDFNDLSSLIHNIENEVDIRADIEEKLSPAEAVSMDAMSEEIDKAYAAL